MDQTLDDAMLQMDQHVSILLIIIIQSVIWMGNFLANKKKDNILNFFFLFLCGCVFVDLWPCCDFHFKCEIIYNLLNLLFKLFWGDYQDFCMLCFDFLWIIDNSRTSIDVVLWWIVSMCIWLSFNFHLEQ